MEREACHEIALEMKQGDTYFLLPIHFIQHILAICDLDFAEDNPNLVLWDGCKVGSISLNELLQKKNHDHDCYAIQIQIGGETMFLLVEQVQDVCVCTHPYTLPELIERKIEFVKECYQIQNHIAYLLDFNVFVNSKWNNDLQKGTL